MSTFLPNSESPEDVHLEQSGSPEVGAFPLPHLHSLLFSAVWVHENYNPHYALLSSPFRPTLCAELFLYHRTLSDPGATGLLPLLVVSGELGCPSGSWLVRKWKGTCSPKATLTEREKRFVLFYLFFSWVILSLFPTSFKWVRNFLII